MTPYKFDLTFIRGTSFSLELVSQVKKFIYDPDVHTAAADLKRTHAENLAHYGFNYEYINFGTTYTKAQLIVKKPWSKAGQPTSKPLLELSAEEGEITLGERSIKIYVDPMATQELDFSSGNYRLLLTLGEEPEEVIDCLVYGTVTVLGE